MHIASVLLAMALQVGHPVPESAQSDFEVVREAYEVALKTDSGGYFGDKDPKAAARGGQECDRLRNRLHGPNAHQAHQQTFAAAARRRVLAKCDTVCAC
jgi:hypothetical protein